MEPARGISKHPPSLPLDFKRLRAEGIAYLQQLSGNEWTDYNTHDPGITLLEALCYSLTDLAYRTELFHESFHKDQPLQPAYKHIYNSKELLQPLPYTKLDFEKYIERIHPNVLYAWFEEEPVFSGSNIVLGGYEVTLMFQHDNSFGNLNTDVIRLSSDDENMLDVLLFNESNERINWKHYKKVVGCKWDESAADNFFVFEVYNCQISLVLEAIYQNRTQSDFLPVKARVSFSKIQKGTRKKFDLESHKKTIIKNLESNEFVEAIDSLLNKERKKNILLTQVRQSLLSCRNLCEDFISIRVANEQEVKLDAEVILNDFAPTATTLLQKIFDTLDTFLLSLVFQSKEQSNKKGKVLYGSNVIEELLKLDGIEGVRILNMNLYIDGVPTISLKQASSFECIQLQRFSDFAPKMSRNKSTITFIRAGTKEDAESEADLDEGFTFSRNFKDEYAAQDLTPEGFPSEGEQFEGLFEYHSFQQDFPQNYGLQETRHNEKLDITGIRRRQFKSYLLFFEKIMIEYLEKLKTFHELLNVNQKPENIQNQLELLKAVLPDIETLKLINESSWNEWRSSTQDQYAQIYRKHKILDHLLARFASPFAPLPATNPDVEEMKKILEDKILLLKDIPEITRERGLGLNLRPVPRAEENEKLITGFQKRVYRLLGIEDRFFKHERHSEIKDKNPSGFYMVEHILLVKKDDKDIAHKKFNNAADILYDYITHMSKEYASHPPYSFQLTIVIPNWYPIWRNRKKNIENIIRAEIPAHILPYFHWLNRKNISDFEACYEDWLKALIQINDYTH